MRFIRSATVILLAGSGWLLGVDFTKFGDICEPTKTQSCPNKPNEIKALQEALNKNPELYLYIRADGKWSKGTKEAIAAFQHHYGIKPANGYLGRYTKKILQRVTYPKSAKRSVSISKKSKLTSKKTDYLHNAKPTKEFVLYGDMCDNSIKGNNCPNNVIEVSNLQILLNADPNLKVNITADGKWGKGTQKAVMAFQKFYGIKPAKGYIGAKSKMMLDRVAGAMLARATMPSHTVSEKRENKGTEKNTAIISWKNICDSTSTDKCPNRDSDVRSLQSYLNKVLHTKLKVDGKWGRGTKQAVIKFQKKNNIKPANGYVGPKTKRAMQKPR